MRGIGLLVLGLLYTIAAQAGGLQFHWEDTFTPAERSMLVAWVEETHRAVEALVGPYPFDVHVHMHRRDGARGPVPWANTRRHRVQAVHFHVDPGHPPSAFRRDWTASHELSHLVLPFLGRRHAWFAEGFASFMQYRVMHAMGTLTAEDMAERYRGKLARAARDYDYPDRPFARAAQALRAERRYPTMYWGGAAYFMQVDAQLRRQRDSDLTTVLRGYLACCRRDRGRLDELVATLDRLADTDAFALALERFYRSPGFPAYHDLE